VSRVFGILTLAVLCDCVPPDSGPSVVRLVDVFEEATVTGSPDIASEASQSQLRFLVEGLRCCRPSNRW